VTGPTKGPQIDDSKHRDVENTKFSQDESDDEEASVDLTISPALTETEALLSACLFCASPKFIKVVPIQHNDSVKNKLVMNSMQT
jgi:hypothetical protein